jgi:hypothetical protein
MSGRLGAAEGLAAAGPRRAGVDLHLRGARIALA